MDSKETVALSKLVEALENQLPGLVRELQTSKAMMLSNFGKKSKVYPEIVADTDDLNMMIRLAFSYMHDRINELKTKNQSLSVYLRATKQFVPVGNDVLIEAINDELNEIK